MTNTWLWEVTGYSEPEYKGKRNGKYWAPKWKTVQVHADTKEEAIEKARAELPADRQAQFKAVQRVRVEVS